jgi:hydroxymethylglutaryl-CoA lyase
MKLPAKVQIREVGPRDGLQAEKNFVPTEAKIELINRIFNCQIKLIEATSFVNPRAIPQLSDAEQVITQIDRPSGSVVSALVGNQRGVQRAIRSGVDEVQVVISASEVHNQRNVNMPIAESLRQLGEVVPQALQAGVVVRAAIATAFGCPFEGEISLKQIFWLTDEFRDLGIKQITLADTAGLGDPLLVSRLVGEVWNRHPELELALHFHDTRGLGLANSLAGLQSGVTILEASLGGLGGCPFIPRATGNIATEDLVFMCDRMGVETNVSLAQILDAARWLETIIGRELPGRVMKIEGFPQDCPLDCC